MYIPAGFTDLQLYHTYQLTTCMLVSIYLMDTGEALQFHLSFLQKNALVWKTL